MVFSLRTTRAGDPGQFARKLRSRLKEPQERRDRKIVTVSQGAIASNYEDMTIAFEAQGGRGTGGRGTANLSDITTSRLLWTNNPDGSISRNRKKWSRASARRRAESRAQTVVAAITCRTPASGNAGFLNYTFLYASMRL